MKFGDLTQQDIISICSSYDECCECPLDKVVPGLYSCMRKDGSESLKDIELPGNTVEDLKGDKKWLEDAKEHLTRDTIELAKSVEKSSW